MTRLCEAGCLIALAVACAGLGGVPRAEAQTVQPSPGAQPIYPGAAKDAPGRPVAQPAVGAQPVATAQPMATAQPVYAESAPPSAGEPIPAGATMNGRGVQYGLHVVVPVYLTKATAATRYDAERLSPGIGLQGRGGWEFPGGWSTELTVGVSRNAYSETSDRGVGNLWLSAGLRYTFMNPTALLPFVGSALQLNLWSDCDEVACAGDAASVGGQVNAGLMFEISRWFALEAGLAANLAGPGNFPRFDGWQFFLWPMVGVTLFS